MRETAIALASRHEVTIGRCARAAAPARMSQEGVVIHRRRRVLCDRCATRAAGVAKDQQRRGRCGATSQKNFKSQSRHQVRHRGRTALKYTELSQNLLGRLVGMDKATMQGVVRRLKERGLVDSRPDPGDARRTLLSLTTEGQRLVNKL